MKLKKVLIAVLLAISALLLSLFIIDHIKSVSKIEAENLSNGIAPNHVTGLAADDKFVNSAVDFSIKLFKESISNSDNSLISPFSLMLALSMTANGAENKHYLRCRRS